MTSESHKDQGKLKNSKYCKSNGILELTKEREKEKKKRERENETDKKRGGGGGGLITS